MPNPTRTILLLVVMAVGALWALGYTAQRYARLLQGADWTAAEAVRGVEDFIKVRRAMLREVETWGAGPADRDALWRARDGAIVRHGADPGTYAEIRSLWRAWREGRLRPGSPVAEALERRRSEVQTLHLGPHEPLDF
jgi:hypothetical protein